MAGRRALRAGVVVALALTGLVSASTPATAAGVLTPSSSTVAVGASLAVDASGCTNPTAPDEPVFSYREPVVRLVTGTGQSARAASIGLNTGEERTTLTVPGWVDPAQPAVLRATCIEYSFDEATPTGPAGTVLFTYPDVAIDVTPATATGVLTPTVSLHRDTAAGGQVIVANISGCAPDAYVETALARGTDLTLGGLPEWVAGTSYDTDGGGSARAEIPLVDSSDALAEGDYVVVVACVAGPDVPDYWFAEPAAVHVVGTNPSGSITVEAGDAAGSLVVAGEGCTGGRTVTVTFRGLSEMPVMGDVLRWAGRRTAARVPIQPPGDQFEDTVEVTPAADGSWTTTWTAPETGFTVDIQADCGDPTAEGFRYVPQQWYESGFSELWVDRVSPTSTPTSGSVEVHVQGLCDEPDATVQLTDTEGTVLDEGPLAGAADSRFRSGRVTAPATPGSYRVGASCGGRPGYPQELEVFAPTHLAATGPLPAEPTTGWPSSGGRSTYHGRIGPISLPATSDPVMSETDRSGATRDQFETVGSSIAVSPTTVPDGVDGPDSPRELGPSALFIDVPRPTGDFAVTGIRFGLVDAAGRPVSQQDAHLHHFVISNTSSTNPACPGGTFGLPGEVLAAVGAERTPVELGDPYGIVVKGTDEWTGVYELMSRAERDQTVFLTYDLDIRRDVGNVRPVRTYFGSATGCSSFTWTVDGSGTPDVQSHYLTVAHDGVLIGAGGHIHNGGLFSDLTDDRGRRLCRATLATGEPLMGPMRGRPGRARPPARADEMTATTVVGDTGDSGEDAMYPPEFYDDDPVIQSISRCSLRERVVAGQRLRFDAVYANDRPRSGAMGIFVLHVWEGGGPPTPGGAHEAPPAEPYDGHPDYAG